MDSQPVEEFEGGAAEEVSEVIEPVFVSFFKGILQCYLCIGGIVVFICILATYFGYMGNQTEMHCLVRFGETKPIPFNTMKPGEIDTFIENKLKEDNVVDITAKWDYLVQFSAI